VNPLHKAPNFLLDLFRLRTQGKQPDEFGTTVGPVVDVHAFYAADLLKTSQTVGAAGAVASYTVTANTGSPIALVGLAAAMTVGAAGGTQLRITVGIALPTVSSGAFFPLFVQGFFNTPLAGQTYWHGGKLPGPKLVIPGGTHLQARFHSNAAGADHVGTLLLMYEDAVGT